MHQFDQAPFIAIWEVTRACGLACKHCRAAADETRDPRELTTLEGRALIDRLAQAGTRIVVFSGGDPLTRTDLAELCYYASGKGLKAATIPAATSRLTRDRLVDLHAAGVHQLAFSLDHAQAEAHDGFRGSPGAWERTVKACGWARELGIPLQINSAFAAWNIETLPELAEHVSQLGIVFWEVFFHVPVGRGDTLGGLNQEQYRKAFDYLHDLQQRVSFIVKITEAPHYRMHVAERERARGGDSKGRTLHLLARETGPQGSIGQAPHGVNSGRGFCFISHVGDIQPSGFLPVTCGNVRTDDLIEVYQHHPFMRSLRDPSQLEGRCGRCRYRTLCGGSRARAWATSGNALAEDRDCWFEPDGQERHVS